MVVARIVATVFVMGASREICVDAWGPDLGCGALIWPLGVRGCDSAWGNGCWAARGLGW